jgi:hypothetical protein
MALLRGETASHVSTTFDICLSDLYKFRKRALIAGRAALKDHPQGPKQPHNRLGSEQEQKVMALCQRYPTHSSYRVRERLGPDAPCARTIQRIRARNHIARLPKRAPPSAPARRIPEQVIKRVRYILKLRPHLGLERVVWDLDNGAQVQIGASTVKRLKRNMQEALHSTPPSPPPPMWRFYERRHPHSLWHGDFTVALCTIVEHLRHRSMSPSA